jgi:hypothetical protein
MELTLQWNQAAVRGFELTEEERVVLWRGENLERAGYNDHSVALLAFESAVDLHLDVELLKHGCPEATAVRILV